MAEDAKKDQATAAVVTVGKFAKPVELAGLILTHFELREATIDDMLSVEMNLSESGRGAHTPIAFNGEMMMRQMVRASNAGGQTFDGPFTMNMLRNFGPKNYRAIRAKQVEIDLLGEADLPSSETS